MAKPKTNVNGFACPECEQAMAFIGSYQSKDGDPILLGHCTECKKMSHVNLYSLAAQITGAFFVETTKRAN